MKVTVRFFAVLRDRAGLNELVIDLADTATVTTARDEIIARSPAVRDLMSRTAFAINREYASLESKLNDGDELALIPPVSGG
jgi:molybdopterin converting factor subunit 1